MMKFFNRLPVTPPQHKDNGRFRSFLRQFKLINRFRKGSPRSPISRGATLRKIWQKIGLPVTGVCPGRSVWHPFIPAAPCARRNSARPVAVSLTAARPETEHHIGGAPTRALSSRRWKTTFQHIKLGRLFPQISGQSKGTTTGYLSCRSESLSPAAPKFFGRAARRVAPQAGRSMIEMLAVLAIMGVLTVGGIAAYSFAVSKHRANQIYNQVDLRAVASFGNPVVCRQTNTSRTNLSFARVR